MKRLYALAALPLAATQCDPQPACAPQPAPVIASRYGVAVWDRIAQCESGGNWSHRPVTNSSGTYSGGLMIGHRWWAANGGDAYSQYPYQATKGQQIAVAENIADEVGLDRGWQCYP
jgi:hypothetical protein